MKKLIILLFVLCFVSCKEKQIVDPDNLLLGTWVNIGYETKSGKSYLLFDKATTLNQNLGYVFYASGKLTNRGNIGFCTPASYADFDGNWTIDNDVITVNVLNMVNTPNPTTYRYKVESVSQNELVLNQLQN